MNKYATILLAFFSFVQIVYSQPDQNNLVNSENGYSLPSSGQLRILLIFAEVDCEDCDQNRNCHPDNVDWRPGQLPDDVDQYIDHSYVEGKYPESVITKFYYEASLGNYLVLGDYFPEIVTVKCSDITGNGTREVIRILNGRKEVLTTANINPATGKRYTLDDFDMWGNEARGKIKSNAPNGFVDAVSIVWRNNKRVGKTCYAGFGMAQILGDQPLQNKKVRIGSSFNACQSGERGMGLLMGEYFHAIFGGNNWHTSSGASYHTFLSYVGSFSITGQGNSAAIIACAWDRFHLGWKNPKKEYLISALGPDRKEVNTEMMTINSHPEGGIFILRDFYTVGDAIRIKLPHISWKKNGDVKNQYLWIENHQLIADTDHSLWIENDCKEDWSPGIYAYIQVGKDVKQGSTAQVYPNYGTNDLSKPNALASWLFPLSAEGHYDFLYRTDMEQSPDPYNCCNWGNRNIPKDKYHPGTLENPFTGFSDLFEAMDYDGNGILFNGNKGARSGDFQIQLGLSEVVDDRVIHNCSSRGDSKDGFRLAHNNRLSISSNPTPRTGIHSCVWNGPDVP